MKYCPYCGVCLQADMVFCPECGKRFQGAVTNTEINENVESTFEETTKIEELENSHHMELLDSENLDNPAFEELSDERRVKHTKVKGWIIISASAILAVAICAIFYFFGRGDTGVTKAANAVLFLEVYDDSGEVTSTASGFVIDDGETLVTNYHVIEDAYKIVAWTADGHKSTELETIIAYDTIADLAILKCKNRVETKPLVLSDSDLAKQGDVVYAVGYPLGLENTLSNGVISSVYVDDTGVELIQTTAAISHGSSGGALLNKRGKVVGVICSYYTDGQNLNLAVSANTVKQLLSSNEEQESLADLYYLNSTYGLSQINLAGGCKYAENNNYFCWVERSTVYAQNKTTGTTIEIGEGRSVNLYKGKLYYSDRDVNDLVCYDFTTGEKTRFYLLDDEKNEEWASGHAKTEFVESIDCFLLAENKVFLKIRISKGNDLGQAVLYCIDLNDPTTVLYISEGPVYDFAYVGEKLYVPINKRNQMLEINMKTLEDRYISLPCEPFIVGSNETSVFFTDNVATRDYTVYSFNCDGTDRIDTFVFSGVHGYRTFAVYNDEIYCSEDGRNIYKMSLTGKQTFVTTATADIFCDFLSYGATDGKLYFYYYAMEHYLDVRTGEVK